MGERSLLNTITVDSSGDEVIYVADEAVNVKIRVLGSGKFKLIWEPDPDLKAADITGWKVYWSSGGWQLQATLKYHRSRREITWTSGSFSHGTSQTFKVATYKTVVAVDYESTGVQVSATADAQGPDPITGLSLS